MRSRTLSILGLLLVSLAVKGESCLLEQRKVSAVLGSSIPAEWQSRGFTETMDDSTIDAGAIIDEALDDADIDPADIKSIAIAGGCYEVVRSSGHDAQREGTVEIDDVLVLSFDVPNNQTGTAGTSGDGTLTLNSAGLTYVNGKLNTFLTALKANPDGPTPPLVFTYKAEWTSTPPPTSGDPDDFDWITCINLQIEYEVEVDVPNPL
ncbi:MAG: hypothetical protein ACKVU1_18300 [bacterium]